MKPTDKERLDWLTKNRKALYPWSNGWTIGGLPGEAPIHRTPRQVIDAAMKKGRKGC